MAVATESTVRDELDYLLTKHGGYLKPIDVVTWARNNEDSALYRQFDWNTKRAALKWQLHQARNLLRVHVTVLAENTQPVRAFVSMVEDRNEQGGYRAMVDVLSDAESRERLLNQALRELEGWQRRYQSLSELAAVFAAVRKVRRRKNT